MVTRAPVAALADSAPVVQQAEPIDNSPAVTREAVQPVQETESPVQSSPPAPVIARSVTPRPATKADYGWLADSLFRRVVELRHYPRTARLNGFEGKVVFGFPSNRMGTWRMSQSCRVPVMSLSTTRRWKRYGEPVHYTSSTSWRDRRW